MASSLRTVLVVALLIGAMSSLAAERFREGVHFFPLAAPVETADPSKIEVVEVFSYACIHCKNFDPVLNRWIEGIDDDVRFRRVPAVFSDAWKKVAAPYFVAENLGVLEEIHEPMFRAIHDERIDMRRPERIAALFNAYAGVEEEKTVAELKSFDVDKALRNAQGLVLTGYQIDGVPAMVINGRYRITVESAGVDEAMLEVVDFVVAKERERLSAEAE